jgi:cytochrome c55X
MKTLFTMHNGSDLAVSGLGIALVLMFSQAVTAASPDKDTLDKKELRNLLVQDCGSCHGLTMRGGLGPALLPETLADKPDAVLVSTIMDGRPGTAMPPWRPLLSEDDANWMVQQLKQGLK